MRGRQHHGAHRGQVLVILAVGSVILLGFLAMAVDVGYLLSQRRGTQNAVDAAALAVADAMYTGITNTTTLNNIANYYLAQNGYNDTATVTPDFTNKKVRVDLTHNVQKFFLGVVYSGAWDVKVHAVAAIAPIPKDYALLALRQSGNPIDFTGNVDINVVGGGAMSNGGMRCVGNGALTADLTVDSNRGFSTTGNCSFAGAQGGSSDAPVVADPLASVPAPPKPAKPTVPGGSSATCTPTNSTTGSNITVTCPNGIYSAAISASGSNVELDFSGDSSSSGSYSFQKDVSVTGNATATFGGVNGACSSANPGTFYFNNSSLNVTGNSTVVLCPGAYYFSGSNKGMNFTGNLNVRFAGDGPWTFYMDGSPVAWNGNANVTYPSNIGDITFYLKNSSNSANTFQVTGNANLQLPSGIYYIDGGGMKLIGNQKIVGNNVFFYFDNGATWGGVGNSQYYLTAPTTPLYPGMPPGLLFFVSRTNTGTFKLVGNTNAQLNGIVYLPSATLSMTGNSSGTLATGQLIVNSLTNVGNTDVQIKYKKYIDISVPAVALIE